MTPRELFLVLEDYNEQRQRYWEETVTAAYFNAKWQKLQRMPSLQKVLEEIKPKQPAKPQTDEQMFAMIQRMHKQMAREEG